MAIKPQQIKVEVETAETNKPDGSKQVKRKISIDTEDLIAIGGIAVAILVVIGMLAGVLPVNEYTAGLAGLSGVGGAIVKIVKARKK